MPFIIGSTTHPTTIDRSCSPPHHKQSRTNPRRCHSSSAPQPPSSRSSRSPHPPHFRRAPVSSPPPAPPAAILLQQSHCARSPSTAPASGPALRSLDRSSILPLH